MKILKTIPLILFAGSTFLISGRFVNETNTPKYYFVVATLLVAAAITTFYKKQISFGAFLSKTTLWGINIICVLQACYGLCQFFDWTLFNHSKFAITGSFDNPAGFAAVLSIGFPIGLYLLVKANKIGRYLAGIILAVIAFSVFFSGSRAGMLAIITSCIIFLVFKTNGINKFRQLKHSRLLTLLVVICFTFCIYFFYEQKKDSADGRLLIWKVSTEMIKDKLLLGHGYGAFQAKYMDYQAEYFKNNPNSTYSQLADNVKRPFNEFIKVTVEFGLIGLTVAFLTILFVFRKTVKSENEYRGLVLSGLASFFVYACFSYPLYYVAVWLFLVFYLSALLPTKEIKISNTPLSIITRTVIVLVCVFFLCHVYKQIRAEIQWETIAVSSIRGNTEKMLPEYEKLYSTPLKRNPFFLYNYGAELNVAGRFDKSIDILNECKKRFNDYDLQMLMADNYNKKGELGKAIQIYQHASNMIPCRFLPLYQIFDIYRKTGQTDMAVKYSTEIINKKVKIPSLAIDSMKSEAEKYLKQNDFSY